MIKEEPGTVKFTETRETAYRQINFFIDFYKFSSGLLLIKEMDQQLVEYDTLPYAGSNLTPSRVYVVLKDDFFAMREQRLLPLEVAHCPGEHGALMTAIPGYTIEEDASLYGFQNIKRQTPMTARDTNCYIINGYNDSRFQTGNHPLQKYKNIKELVQKTACKMSTNQHGDGTASFLDVSTVTPFVHKDDHKKLIRGICKLAGYNPDTEESKLLIYVSCSIDAMMALMYGSMVIIPRSVRKNVDMGGLTNVVTMDAFDMVTQHPQLFKKYEDDSSADEDTEGDEYERLQMSRAALTAKLFQSHEGSAHLSLPEGALFIKSRVLSQLLFNQVLFVAHHSQVDIQDIRKIIHLFDWNFDHQDVFTMPHEWGDECIGHKSLFKQKDIVAASKQRPVTAANFLFLMKSYQDVPSFGQAKNWPTLETAMAKIECKKRQTKFAHVNTPRMTTAKETLKDDMMKTMKCIRATALAVMASSLTSSINDHSSCLLSDETIKRYRNRKRPDGPGGSGTDQQQEYADFDLFEKPSEKAFKPQTIQSHIKGLSIAERLVPALGYDMHLIYQALNDLESFENNPASKIKEAIISRMCVDCRPTFTDNNGEESDFLVLEMCAHQEGGEFCPCMFVPDKVAQVADHTIQKSYLEDGITGLYPLIRPPYFTAGAEEPPYNGGGTGKEGINKKKSEEEVKEELHMRHSTILETALDEISDEVKALLEEYFFQSVAARFAWQPLKAVTVMHAMRNDEMNAKNQPPQHHDLAARMMDAVTEIVRVFNDSANYYTNAAHRQMMKKQCEPNPKSTVSASLSPHATACWGPVMQHLQKATMLKDCDVDARRQHGITIIEAGKNTSYENVKSKLNCVTLGEPNTPFRNRKVILKNCCYTQLTDKWDVCTRQIDDYVDISYPKLMNMKMLAMRKDFNKKKGRQNYRGVGDNGGLDIIGCGVDVAGGFSGCDTLPEIGTGSLKEKRQRLAAMTAAQLVGAFNNDKTTADIGPTPDESGEGCSQADEHKDQFTISVTHARNLESKIALDDKPYIGFGKKINPFGTKDRVMMQPIHNAVFQYLGVVLCKSAIILKRQVRDCETFGHLVALLENHQILRCQRHVHALYKLQQLFIKVSMPGGKSFTSVAEMGSYIYNNRLLLAMPWIYDGFDHQLTNIPYIYFLTAGRKNLGKENGGHTVVPRTVVPMDGAMALAEAPTLVLCRVNNFTFEAGTSKTKMNRSSFCGLTYKDLAILGARDIKRAVDVQNRDEFKEKHPNRVPLMVISLADFARKFDKNKFKHELAGGSRTVEEIVDKLLLLDERGEDETEFVAKLIQAFSAYLSAGNIHDEDDVRDIISEKIYSINSSLIEYEEDVIAGVVSDMSGTKAFEQPQTKKPRLDHPD